MMRTRRDYLVSLATAFALHALVLFAVSPDFHPPTNLIVEESVGEVEVSLVAAIEETVVTEPEPAPVVAPPEPEPPMEPEVQSPPPEPEPEPILPEPPPLEPEAIPDEPKEEEQPVIEPAPLAPQPAAQPPVEVAAAKPAPALAPVVSAPVTANQSRITSEPVVTKEPSYLRKARLYYPRAAIRQRQEGLVVLTIYINPKGRAEKIEVKQSSGYPLLDDAAMDAARDAIYQPARIGERPVATKTEAPYRFVLRDESD